MGRYSPTVLPRYQGGDPGREIADAASLFQQMRRQGRLDDERRERRQEDVDFREGERDYRREQDEYRREQDAIERADREYQTYGQRVRDRPPAEMPQHEILPQEDDELAATFNALREGGFQRPQPEPTPPTPGAFVPGQGFNLRFRGQPAGGPQPGGIAPVPPQSGRTDGIVPPPTDMQPGGMSPSPYGTPNLGARQPPRFEEIGEGRYIDPSLTPEARAREREERQLEEVRARLLAHPEVDETEADLIAGGQMRFGDARDPEEFDPATDPELLRERAMAGEGLGRYNQGTEYDPERDALLQRERMLREEGLGRYAGKTEEESATYQNLVKLVPPITPIQEAAARAIAGGANSEDALRAMASEAGLTEAQTEEALKYLKSVRFAR